MKNVSQKNRFGVLLTVLCVCVACTNQTSEVVVRQNSVVTSTETSSGNGTWACTLAGAGMMSQCVRRKESI